MKKFIEYFKKQTKLFFEPLQKKWFWIYAFPIVVILSAYITYIEHIK